MYLFVKGAYTLVSGASFRTPVYLIPSVSLDKISITEYLTISIINYR